MKQPAYNVTLSSEGAEALIARVHLSNLPRADAAMVERVIRMSFYVVFALQETKLSVKRLRSLLFGQSPKPSPEASSASPSEPLAPGEGGTEPARVAETAGCGVGSVTSPSEGSPKQRGGHRPGTGRLSADAYVGAERVECRHEELAVGQRCPVCGRGTLYELPPSVEMRIDGHALLSAMRYELQKLRCSACGQILTASLPPEAGGEKYSSRARAVLAVSRSYLGMPGYRLQGYQAMLGVPVSDATQWDHIEHVGACCSRGFA